RRGKAYRSSKVFNTGLDVTFGVTINQVGEDFFRVHMRIQNVLSRSNQTFDTLWVIATSTNIVQRPLGSTQLRRVNRGSGVFELFLLHALTIITGHRLNQGVD